MSIPQTQARVRESEAEAAVTIDYVSRQKSLGVGWADAPQPSTIPATPAPIKD